MTSAKAVWSYMWTLNDQVKGIMIALYSSLNLKPTGSEVTAAPLEDHSANRKNEQQQKKSPNYTKSQVVGLIVGPGLFILIKLFVSPAEMSNDAVTVLASVSWVATWWVTEAVPIPITSLLPILLFPLTGVMETGAVSASYGDPLIFLFVGSFMIALTMEKWNLHKRIALSIIAFIGTNPSMIILGFMISTAFLSMWISNTATTMMMVPICLAVTKHVADSLKQYSH